MLNSKEFLLILVSILIFINIFIPLKDKNKYYNKKLQMYQKRMTLEKGFLDDSKNIKIAFKKAREIVIKNNKLLFNNKLKNSQILNQAQAKINMMIKQSNGKVKNIIWGEPYANKNLFIIPMDIILTIYPDDLYDFLNDLLKIKKVFSIKQLYIINNRKNLTVNMRIFLFKLNGKVK